MRPVHPRGPHGSAAGVALVLASILCGSEAGTARAWSPEDARSQPISVLGAELGFFVRSDHPYAMDGDVLVLSPVLHGSFALRRRLQLTIEWPMGIVSVDPPGSAGDTDFVPGNPTLAVGWLIPTRSFDMTLAGGLGLPLTSAADQPGLGVLLGAIRGLWDPWLWSPEKLSLLGTFRADLDHDVLLLAFEAGFGILIAVDDDEETDVALQMSMELGFRARRVAPFVGLRGVFIPTDDGDDFQGSLDLGIRVDVGRAAYVRFGLTMNLDNPFGFAFEDHGVYGVHFGVGGRI